MRLFLLAIAGALAVEAGVASSRTPVSEHASSLAGGLPRRRIPPSHIVHERHEPRHTEGWTRAERAHQEAILPMRIGLRQSNVDLAHELLMNL